MSYRITSLTAAYFQIPLRNPFVISIRSTTYANVIRWRLETGQGDAFLGECVPVQYVTGETPESVLAVAPQLEALLRGESIEDLSKLAAKMEEYFPGDIAARAGVEIALYNAMSRQLAVPVYKLLGAARMMVTTDLTIGRVDNSLQIAEQAWADGFRIFKLKVGGGAMEEDLTRVTTIATHLPESTIRLDANQALTVESTHALTSELLSRGVHIELVEQPVPKEDLRSLAKIAEQSPVPIIADEACKTARDAYEIFSTSAVHGVNVKLMKSGLRGALQIIEVAKAAGRKLMIGCMLESEIGMAASVALACGTGAFDYVDLDGHLLLNLEQPIALFQTQGPQLYFAG